MAARSGTTGPVEVIRDILMAVGVVAAGASADVALPADAAWIGVDALSVSMRGAPLANLVLGGAWVSDPVTGVVTVRVLAGTGGIGAANQPIRLTSQFNNNA
jgi:hypothetical protein